MEQKMINGFIVFDDGRVFKPAVNPGQGESVDYLIAAYNGKRYPIHRLIAEAFVPNPENKPYVNHIDGDSHNNAASNLEWVTASENVTHAWRTGLIKRGRRHNVPNPKWTLNTENMTRLREAKHMNMAQFGRALRVSRQAVKLWESGTQRPSTRRLNEMARVLECAVDELMIFESA